MRAITALAVGLGLAFAQEALAAIGCTLSDPSQDLKYLFPEMTSYREEAKDMTRMQDGRRLFADLEERIGSDLDPVYETFDTPYTLYSVFQGKQLAGIVHGVNVPGKGGVIQVFLATDPGSGAIQKFFFQRLESRAAKVLRAKQFRAQFTGFGLADFYKHDYYLAAEPGSPKDKVGLLRDPTSESAGKADYQATLRGIRKNLVLLDMFVYDRRNEAFYERARQALDKGVAEAVPAAPPDASLTPTGKVTSP